MCDKVVCDKVVGDKVACGKDVCEEVVCERVVFDKVVSDKGARLPRQTKVDVAKRHACHAMHKAAVSDPHGFSEGMLVGERKVGETPLA